MYRLPSTSYSTAPSPRSIDSWLNRATLCVPGARYADSASNRALDFGPGIWRRRKVCVTNVSDGETVSDVSRDGPRRRLAERGEAGPVVDVDQHRPVGLGERDVAAEHLESEDGRRLEGERLEVVLIHLGTLAREPGVRAVPVEEPTVGHAVELHHRPRHVLLQRHPGDPATREGAQRFRQRVQRCS